MPTDPACTVLWGHLTRHYSEWAIGWMRTKGFIIPLTEHAGVAHWSPRFDMAQKFIEAGGPFKTGLKSEVVSRNEKKEEASMTVTLTKTQKDRFENLFERISKKIEQTFGSTLGDVAVSAMQESPYADEDVARTIEVESNGVRYCMTFTAARAE